MNIALTPKSIGADKSQRLTGLLGEASIGPALRFDSGAWQAHGGDQVDYRYEYYNEDNNRMTINTHSVYFEQKLTDAVIAKGELVYDGISGATPTGMRRRLRQRHTTHMQDNRRAISLEFDGKLGSHTLTPGFAYSEESDYLSYGVSLNDAVEFNEKNTTLQQASPTILIRCGRNGKPSHGPVKKDSTEGIVGISQLLSPKTTFRRRLHLRHMTPAI